MGRDSLTYNQGKKRFRIDEYDNDYRTFTGSEYKYFRNQEEADKYCEDESWTGYTYSAREI